MFGMHLRPGFPNDTGWAKANPLTPRPTIPLPFLPSPSNPLPFLENVEFSARNIGNFCPG